MGLDLIFYEILDYDYGKEMEKFEVEKVLELSNSRGMLITNWLYRNDNAKVVGNYLDYAYTYHQITGYKLIKLYKNLKKVIEAEDDKKDSYALFYFPCLYTVDEWVSSVEMFSPAYYGTLKELYESIDNFLFGENASDPSNRMFIYNISW